MKQLKAVRLLTGLTCAMFVWLSVSAPPRAQARITNADSVLLPHPAQIHYWVDNSALAPAVASSSGGWILFAAIVAILVLVLAVVLISLRSTLPLTAALVALAPIAILIAGLVTVASYIMNFNPLSDLIHDSNMEPALMGTVLAFGLWLFLASFYCWFGFPTVSGAQPRSYEMLCTRFDQLDARLGQLCPRPEATQAIMAADQLNRLCPRQAVIPEATEGAARCAWAQRDFLHSVLYRQGESEMPNRPRLNAGYQNIGGLQWVNGDGYIDLWNRLHRAEEALIMLEPVPELVKYIQYDQLRLQGSRIRNHEALLKLLQAATHSLGIGIGQQPERPKLVSGKQVLSPAEVTPDPVGEAEARSTIASVRLGINEFRDGRWDNLVQQRQQLVATGITSGVAAYGLLVLALLMGVDYQPLEVATIFFLVGALTGLFSRLRRANSLESGIYDYGLAHARLIQTPLYSGIAALIGVALVALAPSLFASLQILTPEGAAGSSLATVTATVTASVTATATAAAGATAAASTQAANLFPDLQSIYSLDHNILGLVVAAVFGLTPSLLTSALQKEAEQYKADLKSTEPKSSEA